MNDTRSQVSATPAKPELPDLGHIVPLKPCETAEQAYLMVHGIPYCRCQSHEARLWTRL